MPRRQLATARPQEKTQREVEDLRLVLRARNGDSAAMDALLPQVKQAVDGVTKPVPPVP